MISTQTLPELSVEGSVAPARNPIRSVTGTGGEPIVARIPALDGLRGIASLMVVALHFGPHIAWDGGSFSFLHSLPPLWFQGVDLFFVLSGFLISGILVNAKRSPEYFRTFYMRRVFRIFPLYYTLLAVYVVALVVLQTQVLSLGSLFEHPVPIWYYAVYLQNFAMAAAGNFGPIWLAASWSLAVEEQFYITLPLVIRNVEEKTLCRLACGCIVTAPVLRALIQKFKFAPGLSNYVLLPTSIDALAVGIIVMFLLRRYHEALRANQRAIIFGSAVLALAWTIYPYVPNPEAIRLAFINRTMNSLVFGAILLCLLMLPGSTLARLLSTPLMRSLGNMAYSTYLLHLILLCVVFRLMRAKDPALDSLADLASIGVALLATLGLSWLSWSQFESRLLRIGHRYRY